MPACNVKDICVSFLYMESLKKRGLLDNMSEEMKSKMEDHAIERLRFLAQERERITNKKKSLEGYPSVNFISKDYGNFLNFEEEYTKPVLKNHIETIYDVEYSSDTSVIAKNEEGSTFVPPVVKEGIYPRYDNRENVIVTHLKPEVVSQYFSEMHYKNRDELVTMFDYSDIAETLDELNMRNEFEGIILAALQEYHKLEDDAMQEIASEAYLPIRISNKVVSGMQIDKEKFIEHYLEKIKSAMTRRIKDTSIPNGDDMIQTFWENEINVEILENLINKVQERTDREMNFFIEEIAADNLQTAKKSLDFNTIIQEQVIAIFHSASKGDLYEIDLINSHGTIQLLPVGKKSEVEITYIDTYLTAPEKNDPSNFVKNALIPQKITLKSNIGKSSYVFIESFAESEIEIPKIKNRNVSKAKAYKIEKDFAKNFDKEIYGEEQGNRRTMIVDEADQGAGGQLGDIISYIFKENASKILVATGTPVNGYPESSVNILKFGGSMSLESISESKNEFQTLYGVNSVGSRVLALAVYGAVVSKDIASVIQKEYADIKKIEKDKSNSANLDELYEVSTKKILNALVDKDMIDRESAMSLDIPKESISFRILFDATEKAEVKNKSLSFSSLLQTALINTPALTKRIPKISSIKGFSGTFFTTAGASSVSSTDAGVRKETIFLDENVLRENFRKDDPLINFDVFSENNRSGVRIVQSLVSKYAQNRFLNETYIFLTQNYNGMIKLFGDRGAQGKKLRNTILAYIKEHYTDPKLNDVSESEFYTLMMKTTSSASDSFEDFYKSYVRNNGSMAQLEKEDDARHDLRLSLFEKTLLVFDEFLRDLPKIDKKKKEAEEAKRKGSGKGKEERIVVKAGKFEFDLTGITYKFSPTYTKGENSIDTEEYILSNVSKGYPMNNIFSVNVDLCPHDFEDYIEPNENGERIPYKLELVNKEENQIFDVLGSLGAKHKIKEQMLAGANLVNISQRVFTNAVNVLNYVSSFKEIITDLKNGKLSEDEKNAVEQTLVDNARIIANMTSKGGGRFNLKQVFDQIKDLEGVEFLPTKRNVLDNVTQKSVKYDEKNIMLVSAYESISRGFALDYLYKEIEGVDGSMVKVYPTLNFTDPVGGGDGIQALSRLESPKTDKNLLSIYNGGNDARILFFGEDANKALFEILPTSSDMLSKREDLYRELRESINAIVSLPQREANQMAKNIISTLNLPVSFGITETSINAKKTQTAVETYNMIMEGSYKPLSEEERIRLYQKTEVIDLSEIPEFEQIEDASYNNEFNNSADIMQDERSKEIIDEISEIFENDMDIEEIYANHTHLVTPAP